MKKNDFWLMQLVFGGILATVTLLSYFLTGFIAEAFGLTYTAVEILVPVVVTYFVGYEINSLVQYGSLWLLRHLPPPELPKNKNDKNDDATKFEKNDINDDDDDDFSGTAL